MMDSSLNSSFTANPVVDDADDFDDDPGAPIDIFDNEFKASLEDVELSNKRFNNTKKRVSFFPSASSVHNPQQDDDSAVQNSPEPPLAREEGREGGIDAIMASWENSPNNKNKRRYQKCKIAMLVLALCFGLSWLLVPTVSHKKNKSGSSSSSKTQDGYLDENGEACLQTPLFDPSEPSLTLYSTITPLDALNNPCSVQHLAVHWLLQEELDYALTDKEVLERYSVAVLNLSLSADNMLPGVSVCFWFGVDCTNTDNLSGPHFVEALVWANQELEGSLPNQGEFQALGHLQLLDLAENKITGTLPESLFSCKALQKLYLHDNQLSGPLSDKFANLRLLTHLYLGQNELTGPFPKGLGSTTDSARRLRYLSLYKNKLDGDLPTGLNFRLMYYLDLSHNNFSGNLPVDWAEGSQKMLHLRHLFLNNNQFSGSIPTSYPSMGNGRVEMFHVGDNLLTGVVPGGYNPVNFISSLELQNNLFSSLAPDICDLIVFVPPSSELANLKADCNVCTCEYWCEPGYCY